MTHIEQTRNYLDVVAGHARISVEDGELDPVDMVRVESLLIGWKNDRAVLTDILAKRDR